MFAACTKDNDNTNGNGGGSATGNNSGKHLAKVTLLDDRGNCPLSLRLDWNNDQLSHIYMSEDGYLSKDATLSYSGNQLSTMFVYNYDRHRGNTVRDVLFIWKSRIWVE